MGFVRAQGATQQRSASAYCPLVGQGATEYLVLLAVVLIVALVSVALLGFFPGMASDTQMMQSQMYWRSASPISIDESLALKHNNWGDTVPHLIIRNTGMYPIKLTKVLSGNGLAATEIRCGSLPYCPNATPIFYLINQTETISPGETLGLTFNGYSGINYYRFLLVHTSQSTGSFNVGGASSVCQNVTPYGTMIIPNFGFEYTEYIEGQQITKREIGAKPLIAACVAPV